MECIDMNDVDVFLFTLPVLLTCAYALFYAFRTDRE